MSSAMFAKHKVILCIVLVLPTSLVPFKLPGNYKRSGRNITTIPNDIPVSTRKIDLSQNSITALHSNAFINFTICLYLYLNYNKINRIENSSFEGLDNLKLLDLSNNNIFKIPNAFMSLKNLKWFYLQNNVVEEFSKVDKTGKYSFKGLVSLNLLDLSNNLISNFPNEVFSYLRNLKELY